MGRGRPWRSRSSPTACSRWACARATRSGSSRRRASSGRSSTTRWRGSVRSGRRSTRTARRSDCRYVLEHSDAVGVLVEDEGQRAKIADVAARPRAHLRRPGRAARPRPRARRGQPGRPRRSGGAGRRGRPLHLHLHLGHDRPAEGLHDPPPQLLRDGHVRRPRAGVRARRRRDAALPAARAQLRPADAPARRAHGLHDRLLPGPAARRRGDAGRAPDAAAERAAALREGAHGRARPVRAGARAAAAAARLGARRRARA